MRQLKIGKSITNREAASLERYLQEIGKIDLLSVEEEVELATRSQNGDLAAREKLMKANLRFVVSVAKQYQNRGLPLQDLINEGNIGLGRAAEKFDVSRGFKFISYAVWWIRQGIMAALSESRMVRVPGNKIGLLSKVDKAHNSLLLGMEHEPSAEDLAEMLRVPVEEIEDALYIMQGFKHSSLDVQFETGDEKDNNLYAVIPDTMFKNTDHALETRESLSSQIEDVLKILPEKQRDVIKLFFGIGRKEDEGPMTLEEIGDAMDLTRERVRQIKDKGIIRLKMHRGVQGLLKRYMGA